MPVADVNVPEFVKSLARSSIPLLWKVMDPVFVSVPVEVTVPVVMEIAPALVMVVLEVAPVVTIKFPSALIVSAVVDTAPAFTLKDPLTVTVDVAAMEMPDASVSDPTPAMPLVCTVILLTVEEAADGCVPIFVLVPAAIITLSPLPGIPPQRQFAL